MIPPKVIPKLERRIERLHEWRYRIVAPVALEGAETDEHFRTPPGHLEYRDAPVGSRWGKSWGTVWFRGTVCIPEECAGKRVFYRMTAVGDKLLFVDGRPFAGLDHKHFEVLLAPEARGGESHTIHIEMYSGHPLPGVNPYRSTADEMIHFQATGVWPGSWPPLPIEASELLVERPHTARLYYDADVLLRLAISLDEHSLRRAEILDGLNSAIDLVPLHWQTEDELEDAARRARERLVPLLNCTNGPTAPELGLIGHAHIDIVWLWPLSESIRKCARTFSTMLNLMEDYPEVVYLQAQPIVYELIGQHYPELLPRIKEAAARGAWEPNGGMWVESDTNIPSGESLIRQFLEGRKKTQELFGYYGDTLWLPDVFGYSAALPQILRLCEIDNFVTAKLLGNDTNPIPYDTFDWEGIDGSEVFTHVILSPHWYNEIVQADNVIERWRRVKRKDVTRRALTAVGYGDGGGGLTRESCEEARRMRDLEGCPKCEFVRVSDFLRTMRMDEKPRPRWVGELYYERHRGTYTTQAKLKRSNRVCEFLLREAEWLSVMAMPAGLPYPAAELEAHWRTVLTNQFHDIIPGSSIRKANEEAEAAYAQVEAALRSLRDRALTAAGAALRAPAGDQTYAIANSLSWDRTVLAPLPGGNAAGAVDANGHALICQTVDDGASSSLVAAVPMKAMSVTAIAALSTQQPPAASPFVHSDDRLDTPHYAVRFDAAGKIVSLIDKAASRELVQAGRRLNDFYTAEDVPVVSDAWDIDLYYRDKIQFEDRCVLREIVADGPLFTAIRSRYHIGRHSMLAQDMTFYAHSRRIDFKTDVIWEETQTLLKAGFPLDIHAETYRNEIQFGHVTRPMHSNTSHDVAKFEVCAHKWVDVSEGGYGAALLNDSKYGHDSLDKMVSITLLRSPWAPDEKADKGRHRFTYALLPHLGGFAVETVVREAYELNAEPIALALTPAGAQDTLGLCRVSNANVILETVKNAEAGGAIVLRLYEAGNTRAAARITFERPLKSVQETNCLEHKPRELAIQGHEITLELRPFEIKTLRVEFV